jgi:hypothetical protein
MNGGVIVRLLERDQRLEANIATFGIRMISRAEKLRLGRKEAREVDTSLPLKQRIMKEVENYNEEYGPASTADVVTEINTRGKDLEFQGELEHYAKAGTPRVQKALDKLVSERKIREVKVRGAMIGYAVWRSGPRGKAGRRTRYRATPKAIIDFTPEDL